MDTDNKPRKLPSFSMNLDTVVEEVENVTKPTTEPIKSVEPSPKAKTRIQAKRKEADQLRSKSKSMITAWVPDSIKDEVEDILHRQKRRTGKRKSLTSLVNELLEDYVQSNRESDKN